MSGTMRVVDGTVVRRAMTTSRALSVVHDPARVWERQVYDTPESYTSFLRDFLSLTGERTISDAYRNYCKRLGKPEPGYDPNLNADVIPHTYQVWFNGTDRLGRRSRGTRYEFALSWPERADAWENHTAKLVLARRQQRALLVSDTEWEFAQALKQRFAELLTIPVIATEPSEADIDRRAETISKLMRRSTGLPTDKVEVDMWRREAQQNGLDPESIYEQAVALFSAQLAATRAAASPPALPGSVGTVDGESTAGSAAPLAD